LRFAGFFAFLAGFFAALRFAGFFAFFAFFFAGIIFFVNVKEYNDVDQNFFTKVIRRSRTYSIEQKIL